MSLVLVALLFACTEPPPEPEPPPLAGCEERAAQDWGDDGTEDTVVETLYNDQGHIVRREEDLGADGSIDFTGVGEHDTGGILERLVWHDASEEASRMEEFDWIGPWIERHAYDDDADGQLDWEIRQAIGPLGPMSTETDLDMDGVIDSRDTWVYDGGRVSVIRHDDGANGTVDSSTWVHHSESGEERVTRDGERTSGTLLRRSLYELDDLDRVLTHHVDMDGDDTWDVVVRYDRACPQLATGSQGTRLAP